MIYVSPEDDLTSVRERLEGVPSKRVTLIIPSHTQLRSHVAWKLLHARAREMGKEVLIVSSDPQIRSVAQAVKFKVANSLEASQSGQIRSAGSSRSGRVSSGGRGRSPSGASQRTAAGKDAADGRSTDSSRLRSQRQTNRGATERSLETPSGKVSRADETVTRDTDNAISSSFHMPEKPYGQPYDFRIDTAPPIHPLSSDEIEEPDLFLEDYHLSQNIRQAASGEMPRVGFQAAPDKTPAEPEELSPDDDSLFAHKFTPLPSISDDPFVYMQDSQPPPSAEQKAAVSMEPFAAERHEIKDTSEPPIEFVGGEIEYQGDLGDFVVHSDKHPTSHSWVESSLEDEADNAGPSQTNSFRPRSNRTGAGLAGKELRLPPGHRMEEDALPPIEEVPTRIIPHASQPLQRSQARSGPMRPVPTSPREGQATGAAGARSARSQPLQPSTRSARSPLSSTGAVVRARAGNAMSQSQKVITRQITRQLDRHRQIVANSILIAVVVLLLLVIGTLAYFGPSADISITVPSRDYVHAISLTARSNVAANAGLTTIAADTQTKTFTSNGTGNATGTTKVGTVPASGTVFFTNNGTAPVEIPTGSVIATNGVNAVLFTTVADAVISPSSSNLPPIPVPIQAQRPGDSGNVGAGNITAIPDDSLNAIAQFNKVAVTDLKLKVVNNQDTKGGGTGTATIVAKQDLDGITKSLHAQTQGDIDAWLKQLSANGMIGKPTITDTLINAPKEGQVVSSASFPATLQVNVTTLYLPTTKLQAATLAQLNGLIKQDKTYQNYIVVADAQHPVRMDGMKQSSNNTTLTLNFTATARATPNLAASLVQREIAGKSIKDAQTTLTSLTPDIQKVDIKVFPTFITWMPFWSGHINVKFVPGATPPTKQKAG